MRAQQISRVSGKALVVLSLIALLAVLSGFTQPPQVDEGTGAHIFQLSIVALVPVIFLFLATADWRRPLRSVGRPLAIPAAAPRSGLNSCHGCEQPQNPAGDPKRTAGFRFIILRIRLPPRENAAACCAKAATLVFAIPLARTIFPIANFFRPCSR